jgi:hypothetical protein
VSAIPITEKLLLNAGGWQAMKPARELLKSGRVSEAKYEPPLLSGYVREGAKTYRSGLRIKSALDVENRNRTATRSRTFSEFVEASLEWRFATANPSFGGPVASWIVMTWLHEANSESFVSKGATFSREHSE